MEVTGELGYGAIAVRRILTGSIRDGAHDEMRRVFHGMHTL